MLSSGVGNNFEVVDSIEEGAVGGYGPEVVVGFVEECVTEVGAECYLFR